MVAAASTRYPTLPANGMAMRGYGNKKNMSPQKQSGKEVFPSPLQYSEILSGTLNAQNIVNLFSSAQPSFILASW